MTLEQFKQKVISYFKQCYSTNIMFAVYPQWLQGNIDAGRCGCIAQDKINMDIFLNEKWANINTAEAAINALTNLDIFNNFPLSNDATESAYVGSMLTSLTTDEQKLYLACAIRILK